MHLHLPRASSRRLGQILAASAVLLIAAMLPAAAGDYRKNQPSNHYGWSYPAHGSYFQAIPGFGSHQNQYGHKPKKWHKSKQQWHQQHGQKKKHYQPYRHHSFKQGQVIYLPPPPPGRAYYYRNGQIYLWP
jgi:hypothetical protein